MKKLCDGIAGVYHEALFSSAPFGQCFPRDMKKLGKQRDSLVKV
jgi:hypothetical protein